MNKTTVIGLTGGIASGKTAVFLHLKNKGAVAISLDERAKELWAPGGALFDEALDLFGVECCASGKWDTRLVASVLFNNEDIKKRFEDILYPWLKRMIFNEVEILRDEDEPRVIVIESALLFEEHYDEICDEIWVVTADDEIRKERLRKTRKYSEERINKTMSLQMDQEMLSKKADVVISNNTSYEDLISRVDTEWERITDLK